MDTKIYKNSFTFGKVGYYNPDRKSNLVRLTMELKLRDNKPEFTAQGEIWNAGHTDILTGGQCIDDIWYQFQKQIKNPDLFKKILDLWKKWHLNDLNAGCKHQREMGWGDKDIIINEYQLKDPVWNHQMKLEETAKIQLAKTGKVEVTKEQQFILNLQWRITCDKLPEGLKKFYKVIKAEKKTDGWVNYKEHPEGKMGKPCPVCGYKYGTAWKYRRITTEDLKEILELLGVEQKEREEILKINNTITSE